jgi:hypothetical protein
MEQHYHLQRDYCLRRALQGGGGEEEKEHPLLHKYYQIKMPRTSVRGQGSMWKIRKMVSKKEERRMRRHLYIQIPAPVWACASTHTDPNTHTGMSITGNGNMRILVPTYIRGLLPCYTATAISQSKNMQLAPLQCGYSNTPAMAICRLQQYAGYGNRLAMAIRWRKNT